MIFEIHPLADREVGDAAVWYDERSSGRGSDFVMAVRAEYRAIRDNPRMYALADDAPAGLEIRVAVLRRFPYRVIYLVRSGVNSVLAVAHTRRRSGYWHSRLAP